MSNSFHDSRSIFHHHHCNTSNHIHKLMTVVFLSYSCFIYSLVKSKISTTFHCEIHIYKFRTLRSLKVRSGYFLLRVLKKHVRNDEHLYQFLSNLEQNICLISLCHSVKIEEIWLQPCLLLPSMQDEIFF